MSQARRTRRFEWKRKAFFQSAVRFIGGRLNIKFAILIIDKLGTDFQHFSWYSTVHNKLISLEKVT